MEVIHRSCNNSNIYEIKKLGSAGKNSMREENKLEKYGHETQKARRIIQVTKGLKPYICTHFRTQTHFQLLFFKLVPIVFSHWEDAAEHISGGRGEEGEGKKG